MPGPWQLRPGSESRGRQPRALQGDLVPVILTGCFVLAVCLIFYCIYFMKALKRKVINLLCSSHTRVSSWLPLGWYLGSVLLRNFMFLGNRRSSRKAPPSGSRSREASQPLPLRSRQRLHHGAAEWAGGSLLDETLCSRRTAGRSFPPDSGETEDFPGAAGQHPRY